VAIGSAGGGWISDRILIATGSRSLARKWLSAVSALACTGLILVTPAIDSAVAAVLVISLGTFVAALSGPCAYAITIDLGGTHFVSVFSTMNMCGNIGSAVFPHLVPPLVDATGSWHAVLYLFAGIYGAAGLIWMCLDADAEIFPRETP
jgi:ACS family glucarate transporter-like MFS transporter